MLALSDEELDVVFDLARPLEPQLRDPFFRSLATELERYPETGVGLVFRVGKQLQRDFLRPPSGHEASLVLKWALTGSFGFALPDAPGGLRSRCAPAAADNSEPGLDPRNACEACRDPRAI